MALIPSNRRPYGSWVLGTNTGVVGGVPSRTTIFDDNGSGITASLDSIDNTGATDVSTAIQAAINACISGQVVRLPEGIFRIDATLTLPSSFNGKSFRGAGMGLTTIKSYVNQAIIAGSGSGYFTPVTPVTVTAGATAGSTSITCDGDISYITTNSVIRLGFANLLDPLVYSVYSYNVETNSSPFNQVVRVTGKVGQVLSIFPELMMDVSGEIRISTQSFSAYDIGVEDMSVDSQEYTGGGGSYSGVSMQQCVNSWVTNVESINALNYGIIMADCVNCSVIGCWAGELKGTGSNGAGLLFSGWRCHVEDNDFVDAFPSIEVNAGSMGNVFSYNFSNGQANTNHSPHNRFNLHEGNAWNHQKSDGYFGSESDLTLFRCLMYAGNANFNRFSRNCSLIGCITQSETGTGYPNIGNIYFDGTCQLSLGDPWRDYGMEGTLSDRIDDTHAEITVTTGGFLAYDSLAIHRVYLYWGTNNENVAIGNVAADGWDNPVATIELISGVFPAEGTEFVIGPGAFSSSIPSEGTFQELDLDVAATLVDKLTYRVDNDTLSSGGGDTLYDSEIYASTPDWWPVGMDWPPIDPEDPETTNFYTRVPAGLRYSEVIPDEPPEITTPCTVTGTPVQGQILTAVAGTVTGNPPPTRTWKWQRDGVDIVGATSVTYLLTGDDVGFDVGPVQIETNSEGFDESVATPLTILAFEGDILVVTQVANATPVTELWRRGALTSGVAAAPSYYLVQHSGPYPTQPDNNFVYQRFGTPQDHVYVFQGTVSEAEAIASVP